MARGIRLCLLSVFVACVCAVASSIPGDRTLTTCEGVKPIFEMKNISTEIPDYPISGADLVVCEGATSCCTREMETNLRHLVRNDFQALLHHNSRSLEGLLATTASKLQDHVAELTRQSENKTQSLFSQVYHRIAPIARPSIRTLYADLTTYLAVPAAPNATTTTTTTTTTNPGEQNLEDSVKHFFTDLFPLIYHHAVNPHLRDFSAEYKSCLRTALPEIQPFGNVPRQLSTSIGKTMEATRVLLQALHLGAEVLNSTDMLLNGDSETHECHTALLRMSYCARCQGLKREVKPCAGYCLNVLRGCLTQHAAELDLPWNGFVEATERLVVAVRGHDTRGVVLDVEQVLTTLDSRILEAIMFAMENGPELEKKVKRTCGQARWMSEKEPHHHHVIPADPAGPVAGVTVTQGHISTGQGHMRSDTDSLSTQLHHFLASLSKSRGFYANLAESLCSDESFAETRDTADCWNGKRVGEYTKTVVAASLSAQKYNPELTWTQRSPDARIAQLSDKLRHIRQVVLSQLTLAPESDSYMAEGEEGSGSGQHSVSRWQDGRNDDEEENEWADGSGSGDGTAQRPTGIDPGSGKSVNKPDSKYPTTKPNDKPTSSSSSLHASLSQTFTVILACLCVALRNG